MTEIPIFLLLLVIFIAALRTRLLAWLAARPFLTLIIALIGGIAYRRFGLPGMDPELARTIARFGLAMLGFFAAQQCRFSRLSIISAPAFRLAVFGTLTYLILFAITGFSIVPGLGILGAVLVGAGVMLGGAPTVATPLLNAPVEPATKCAARVESGAALAVALPLALLIEAGASPSDAGAPLASLAIFKSLAGFAVGGTMGLLAGRFLSISSAAIPVMPFLIAIVTYGAGVYTGFDPVMAAIGAGLLYSEEVSIRGDVRTRLWRIGEGLISPVAMIGLGFLLGPILFSADLLVWLAAAIAAIGSRAGARFIALQRLDLSAQDQGFLIWYGGAPGAAAALFLITLMGSTIPVLSELALQLGAATTVLGIAVTRIQSRPLTTRLVQATARARKRRYGTA